ncbi:NAD(P)-binding protein [Mycena polygramma]|nr:NAD(P)-binding protein [Mycena polygramma]
MAFTLRWAVCGTGNMATKFVEDLLISPATRGVHDLKHALTAVLSSTSRERAETFSAGFAQQTTTSVGLYTKLEDLVADGNVDAVYIASPTSKHYEHASICLKAGKAVLCEKALTINATQAQHLTALAKKHNVLLAEALWTRYFPITQRVLDLIHRDKILGDLHRITSDLSLDFARNDPAHSINNAEHGGGALLAAGVYPLTWALLALHDPTKKNELPQISSAMIMADNGRGVLADQQTSLTLVYPETKRMALVSCSLNMRTPHGRHVFIEGSKGTLTLPDSSYRPESIKIDLYKTKTEPASSRTEEFQVPGKGLFYQADAVARAIRDGKTQVEECTWDDSILLMKVMDAAREKCGFRYPDSLESTA